MSRLDHTCEGCCCGGAGAEEAAEREIYDKGRMSVEGYKKFMGYMAMMRMRPEESLAELEQVNMAIGLREQRAMDAVGEFMRRRLAQESRERKRMAQTYAKKRREETFSVIFLKNGGLHPLPRGA